MLVLHKQRKPACARSLAYVIPRHHASNKHRANFEKFTHLQFRLKFCLVDVAELIFNFDPIQNPITLNDPIEIVVAFRPMFLADCAHLPLPNAKASMSKTRIGQKLAMLAERARKDWIGKLPN